MERKKTQVRGALAPNVACGREAPAYNGALIESADGPPPAIMGATANMVSTASVAAAKAKVRRRERRE